MHLFVSIAIILDLVKIYSLTALTSEALDENVLRKPGQNGRWWAKKKSFKAELKRGKIGNQFRVERRERIIDEQDHEDAEEGGSALHRGGEA